MARAHTHCWSYALILSGQTIRKLCTHGYHMIDPFCERGVVQGLSYGLSVAGYDIRIAEDHILGPGHFGLGSSMERFSMPGNVMGRVCDKSTLARSGLSVLNTIIEPGWRGYLTLELKNLKEWPFSIKAGAPIAQIVFEMTDEVCEAPYSSKYQDQGAGPQPPRYE